MKSVGATARNVIGSVLSKVNNETLVYMAKKSSLSRNLQNFRKTDHLPNPTTIQFSIPEKFRELTLHDSGENDPDRILAFGDKGLLGQIDSGTIFGDGTFDKAPNLFYQLYTWHAQVGNSFPPCVYFLLQKKNEATYKRMFQIMLMLIPSLAPDIILLDFEMAAINAARNAFPQAEVKGCYFHLCQSILRKIGNVGLKITFEKDLEKKLMLKSLAALAFIRIKDVKNVFTELAATFPEEESYNSVLTYFFPPILRVRQAESPFSQHHCGIIMIQFWNVHLRQQTAAKDFTMH